MFNQKMIDSLSVEILIISLLLNFFQFIIFIYTMITRNIKLLVLLYIWVLIFTTGNRLFKLILNILTNWRAYNNMI